MPVKFKRLLPYLVSVLVLVGVGVLLANRDQALDWWKLRGYDVPGVVASLAEDTTMTDYGRRLFYVNEPTLDGKDTFNKNCADVIDEAAVLGCYRGDRHGIHIYDIKDVRWHGIKEVTAAHEMLHQAYDRLNEDERKSINNLLLDFYESGQLDQSIADKLALYGDQGQDVLVNEMHSIFGTEVQNLPDELEEYYSQFFNDRSRVLAFRASSRAAFEDYRSQIESFEQRLGQLKSQIDSNEVELDNRLSQLNDMRGQLESDLAAGRIEQYNAGVAEFNQLVSSYNDLLDQTRQLVFEHNELVKQRNDVAIKVEDLNAALDSRLTPQ